MNNALHRSPIAPLTYRDEPSARGVDGFHHPASEEDLIALVRRAAREGKRLRVRGSAHSVASAIYTGPRRGDGHLDVMLDRYAGICGWDVERMQVTVESGCHLGDDPRDPTMLATWERSLLCALEARAWALPDLGGVTHQTVSGFFLTGSAGGTVRHRVSDAVVGLRFICGRGRVHEVSRGDELFDAVLCSMGLLGVISRVTLQCVPHYDVIGTERITGEDEASFSLYDEGPSGLEQHLRRTEYARLMWWPQAGVRRAVSWEARRMQPDDYVGRGVPGALTPKPYSALAADLGSPRLTALADRASQHAAGAFFDLLAQSKRVSRSLAERVPLAARGAQAVRSAFARRVLPGVIRGFVPAGSAQEFWGSYARVLPMDNGMSERAIPTEFTELWLPLDRTAEILRALRAHYEARGYDATGPFLCEIYAAKSTTAWMHPGYGRDSLRIDLFWFGRNHEDPVDGWFKQFWELLQPFDYRLHWGKHLPRDPRLGYQHLRRVTPRWDEFLAARERLDPKRVFLTPYWASALGVEA
jgi:D-arabinono-1,4-lactone oxidase